MTTGCAFRATTPRVKVALDEAAGELQRWWDRVNADLAAQGWDHKPLVTQGFSALTLHGLRKRDDGTVPDGWRALKHDDRVVPTRKAAKQWVADHQAPNVHPLNVLERDFGAPSMVLGAGCWHQPGVHELPDGTPCVTYPCPAEMVGWDGGDHFEPMPMSEYHRVHEDAEVGAP